VIAKTPYALLSFLKGNYNLRKRNECHKSVLRNIDAIAVKKIDKIEKEKKVSRKDFFEN
jgi:hypothetical protein